jgi:sec-independent protein translocase protein TatA
MASARMTRKIGAVTTFHQVFRTFFELTGKGCYIADQPKEPAMPGMGELVVILLIVLVVFGANKLPGIGDALGRSIKNFKKASTTDEGKELEATKNSGKELEAGSASKAKELAAGSDKKDDGEWEEVVVRRKKNPG